MFLSRLSRELQGRGSCLPAGCMLWAQSEAEQGSAGWPEGGGDWGLGADMDKEPISNSPQLFKVFFSNFKQNCVFVKTTLFGQHWICGPYSLLIRQAIPSKREHVKGF